jgi:hypothetical protein
MCAVCPLATCPQSAFCSLPKSLSTMLDRLSTYFFPLETLSIGSTEYCRGMSLHLDMLSPGSDVAFGCVRLSCPEFLRSVPCVGMYFLAEIWKTCSGSCSLLAQHLRVPLRGPRNFPSDVDLRALPPQRALLLPLNPRTLPIPRNVRPFLQAHRYCLAPIESYMMSGRARGPFWRV